MVSLSCAFTGHRPSGFPWGYDETASGCILLKETLEKQIKTLADSGVMHFYSGMALGVDQWCAQIVLRLKKEMPELRLHCILPCKGQECRWSLPAREQYRIILQQADSVQILSEHYTNGCMLARNRLLVESANLLLAVWNGSPHSGTGSTVNYVRRRGRKIIVVDPTTQAVALYR